MKRRGFLKALFAAPAAPAVLAMAPKVEAAVAAVSAPAVAASPAAIAVAAAAVASQFDGTMFTACCTVSMGASLSHRSAIQTSEVEGEFSDEDFDSDYWDEEDDDD
jgi:hypothetical protein